LQCKENDPAPTGENNVVQGNEEDQCADLTPLDTTPPETTILTGPPATTTEIDVTFTFTGSDNATAALLLLFECSNNGVVYEACISPHNVQGLTAGEHQLQVRTIDAALNIDPTPASYVWMVEPSPGTGLSWKLYLPFVVRNDN
jgi:hypothetical protein